MEKEDDDLIIQYATRHYSNHHCQSFSEFEFDLKRVQKIQKLFTRRETQRSNGKETSNVDRILLNHVIILFNVFTIVFAKTILFAMIEEKFHPSLKTILVFLSFMDEHEKENLPIDDSFVAFLRRI